MVVKVFRYAARPPISQLDNIQDRFFRGHQLRNKLVEIEQQKRLKTDAVLQESNIEVAKQQGEIDALTVQIDLAAEAIKRQNQQNRKRVKVDPAQRAVLKELRQRRSELKKAFRVLKKTLRADSAGKAAQLDPELAAMEARYKCMADKKSAEFLGPNNRIRLQLKAVINARTAEVLTGFAAEVFRIKSEAIAQAKAAKDAADLYVYHVTAIDDDVARACKKQPQFRRYTGCGRLYTQIQKGLPTAKVEVGNGHFRLVGKGQMRTAYIRIDTAGREPVWTIVPVLVHRPLPENAILVGVRLVKYRIATHDYWEVQIECKMDEHVLPDRVVNDGCCAIDLGWRKRDAGIRVAYWVGDDTKGGGKGELVIPWSYVARWEQIDSLQSIRDTKFDEARNQLRDWLKIHNVPEWLQEETKTLSQWRSCRRLARLLGVWRKQRFSGDEIIYVVLNGSEEKVRQFINGKWRLIGSGWRNWDKHLYEWQEQLRAKALRWRDDYYRKFAAQLSRRYGIVRLEDADWRQMAQKANPEDESNDAIRRFQRIAAPGRLREICEQRFARWQEVKSAGTTSTCHECGQPIQIGGADTGICACGVVWDRDENACYNILMSNQVTESGCNQSRGLVASETPGSLDSYAA